MLVFHIVDHAWDMFSRAPVLILGSFHLSLMSAIGFGLWVDPRKFGHPISCDPTLTIVGSPVLFSSRPLRIFSLAMYFLLLIPGINLLPPIFFFLALHITYNKLRSWWNQRSATSTDTESAIHTDSVNPSAQPPSSDQVVHTNLLITGLVLLVVINIIFVVDLELTLSRNKHLQSGGDGLWGFGQVLALLLLVVPLRDAWNALGDIQAGLRRVQQRSQQLFLREITATPLSDILAELIDQEADPRAPISGTEFENFLQLAAYHGAEELVKFLLSEEIPADKRVIDTEPSGTYGTALQAASANGHKAVVQLLLDNRTDKKEYINIVARLISWVGGCYGSALCAACTNDTVEMPKLLIAEGAKAELNGIGEQFGYPLHVASLVGNTGMIMLLLEKLENKNRNVEWDIFGTALDVAKGLNNEAVGLLTEGGLKELYPNAFTTDSALGCKSSSVSTVPTLLTTAFLPMHSSLFFTLVQQRPAVSYPPSPLPTYC
ncbi:ankyrin repeat-containing domain protein [Mycena metata]|uniref:Ankyrin repeat-containing domain protein n=1 Tax=Mycena metata TaxID=1033252 RepID=A0AAD7IZ16_9AGAR|nr:ankyrin repeat-containing domain protein [Mycena metata]